MSSDVIDVPASDNPIKEKDDLGPFAHDRDEDDHGERGQRPAPRADVDADLAQLGDELAAVLRHPHIVPGETDDGDDEHARIQQLLARAGKGVGNGAGKDRDDARA